jgi:hypothetical protein
MFFIGQQDKSVGNSGTGRGGSMQAGIQQEKDQKKKRAFKHSFIFLMT